MREFSSKDCQDALTALDNYYSDEAWVKNHKDIVRHALTAMADEGWVLMPKEPTGEMIDKAWQRGKLYRKELVIAYHSFLSARPHHGGRK